MNVVSERFISRAMPSISPSERPVARGNTARGLPVSGLSVNTSTLQKSKNRSRKEIACRPGPKALPRIKASAQLFAASSVATAHGEVSMPASRGRGGDLAIRDRRVSRRVQQFPESVIREMTRIAALHGAVNLAQGFPDFDPPPEVVVAAKNALEAGYNQYSITWGARELREAIARKAKRFNGIDADPEKNLVVTCGSTEAMMAAMLSLVNPGDEVVVFEPFYENYGPNAVVSGA